MDLRYSEEKISRLILDSSKKRPDRLSLAETAIGSLFLYENGTSDEADVPFIFYKIKFSRPTDNYFSARSSMKTFLSFSHSTHISNHLPTVPEDSTNTGQSEG